MRKPHSSSLNTESWSSDSHAAPHPPTLPLEAQEAQEVGV